jgi:hypothetical protein
VDTRTAAAPQLEQEHASATAALAFANRVEIGARKGFAAINADLTAVQVPACAGGSRRGAALLCVVEKCKCNLVIWVPSAQCEQSKAGRYVSFPRPSP